MVPRIIISKKTPLEECAHLNEANNTRGRNRPCMSIRGQLLPGTGMSLLQCTQQRSAEPSRGCDHAPVNINDQGDEETYHTCQLVPGSYMRTAVHTRHYCCCCSTHFSYLLLSVAGLRGGLSNLPSCPTATRQRNYCCTTAAALRMHSHTEQVPGSKLGTRKM